MQATVSASRAHVGLRYIYVMPPRGVKNVDSGAVALNMMSNDYCVSYAPIPYISFRTPLWASEEQAKLWQALEIGGRPHDGHDIIVRRYSVPFSPFSNTRVIPWP